MSKRNDAFDSVFIIEAGRPSWPAAELLNCEMNVITSSTVTSGSVIHSIHISAYDKASTLEIIFADKDLPTLSYIIVIKCICNSIIICS